MKKKELKKDPVYQGVKVDDTLKYIYDSLKFVFENKDIRLNEQEGLITISPCSLEDYKYIKNKWQWVSEEKRAEYKVDIAFNIRTGLISIWVKKRGKVI